MKRYLFLISLCWAAVSAFAQIQEPEDPEIILPEMLMQVEELTEARVEAVLPRFQSVLRTEVGVELPEAEILAVDDLVYEVPQIRTEEEPVGPVDLSTFYSEGNIGFGVMNWMRGEIMLYKLGQDPRFEIGFSHEAIDGYWNGSGFTAQGSGSHRKETRVDGEFSLSYENFGLVGEAGYREDENGLQGVNPSYTAVIQQFIDAGTTVDWSILTDLNFFGSVFFQSGRKVLGGGTPLASSDLNTGLDGGVVWTPGDFLVGGGASYRYSSTAGTTTSSHDIEAYIDAGYRLSPSWDFSGQARLFFRPGEALRYPFSLKAEGTLGGVLEMDFSGGYLIEEQSYAELWKTQPLLSFGSVMDPLEGWYGAGVFEYFPVEGFSFALDLFGGSFSGIPVLGYNATSHLYDLSFRSGMLLETALRGDWEILPGFVWTLGWDASFPGGDGVVPDQRILTNIGYQADEDLWGIEMDVIHEFDVSDFTGNMPFLNLGGFFNPAQNVHFTLKMNDLLSLFISTGRPLWTEYVAPGFNVMLESRISL